MIVMMMLLMLAGVWSVVVSLVTTPLLPNRLVTAPLSLTPVGGAMLLSTALVTLLAVWWTVTAVAILQHPTLISMLRSAEICLSLGTEAIYWGVAPSGVSVLGTIIVRTNCP